MTLRLGTVSEDARYQAWGRVAERIYNEQVAQAWRHYMFRLVRAVFAMNPILAEEGGFVLKWMADNYVDTALMLLRRELDQQDGTENVRNLLDDIIAHPNVLTQARYRANWGQHGPPFDRHHADRVFDGFKPKRGEGDPDTDHVDPDVVRSDLDQMVASTELLRQYAERTRAHRTPDRSMDSSSITFNAMHDAIADARRVIGKYYALLTLGSIAQWEPVPQYDTLKPFMRPWVVDRTAVEEAAKERP